MGEADPTTYFYLSHKRETTVVFNITRRTRKTQRSSLKGERRELFHLQKKNNSPLGRGRARLKREDFISRKNVSAKWKSNLEHRRKYEPFAFECGNLCDDILRECQTFMKDFSIFSFTREIPAVLTQNCSLLLEPDVSFFIPRAFNKRILRFPGN